MSEGQVSCATWTTFQGPRYWGQSESIIQVTRSNFESDDWLETAEAEACSANTHAAGSVTVSSDKVTHCCPGRSLRVSAQSVRRYSTIAISYCPSSPSGDFDRGKLLEWLRSVESPSKIEEAMLWFLDPDVTFSGRFAISPHVRRDTPLDVTGKLPTEILVTIFEFAKDLKVSRSILQSVNKRWFTAMRSPSMWNEITLGIVQSRLCVYGSSRLVQLMRFLQLSGGVALDVRIVTHDHKGIDLPGTEPVQIPLEIILSRCDTKRWRSLVVDLNTSSQAEDLPQAGRISSNCIFPSLKWMTVSDTSFGFLVSSGIREAISKSTPPLHEVELAHEAYNDKILAHSQLLGFLRTIRADPKSISVLPFSSNLRKLHITTILGEYLPQLALVKLPATVILPSISTQALRQLQCSRVRHLTIGELTPVMLVHERSIPFPELQVLVITKGDFRSIIYLSAPDLQELRIGTKHLCKKDYPRANNADMITIFRDLPHYLKICPKILKTRLPMTTELTMLLFETWHQLEQISIRVIDTFECTWLVEGLIKRKRVKGTDTATGAPWKYCPSLRWLKVTIDAHVGQTGEWGEYARAILCGRRESRLTCVSWIYGNAPEVVLNREDLDTRCTCERSVFLGITH